MVWMLRMNGVSLAVAFPPPYMVLQMDLGFRRPSGANSMWVPSRKSVGSMIPRHRHVVRLDGTIGSDRTAGR